jgi:hypothetical protein
MVDKNKIDAETRRANLSFLQLIFPSFLLVILPMITTSPLTQLVLGITVFSYQYYLIQSFVKSIYS